MSESLPTNVQLLPEYSLLLQRRRALILPLLLTTLVIYYAFILAIAFFPDFLSIRAGDGVTSIGIWIGLGVIVATVGITGVYVNKANGEIKQLLETIHEKAGQ